MTEPFKTTEFGEFYHFTVATLFPFDLRLVERAIMTDEEIEWLNSYHARVREELTPLLNPAEAAWLEEKTKAI